MGHINLRTETTNPALTLQGVRGERGGNVDGLRSPVRTAEVVGEGGGGDRVCGE